MGSIKPRPRVVEGVAASTSPACEVDEQSALARIRTGDVAAFEWLVRTYATPMWQIALGYVKLPQLADELVQEVFAQVWMQRARWVVHEGVRLYLFASVRNGALRVLRRERVTARWEAKAITDVGLSGMGQEPRPADEHLRRQEIDDAVRQAVMALPRRRREAYTLRWQHHLTNPEIADVMGISLKAVERAISAAMKTLRTELARFY